MKNIFIYLLGIGILLVSCEKDIEVIKSSLTVSNEEVTPSYTSAEIAVDFAPVQITDHINSGTHFDQVFVQYATSKDFAEYQEEEMQHSGWWRASLTNLQPNTTYYVRYFVKNKYSSAISNEVSEFKTLALSLPSITTSAVTQIRDTSAIAGGNVTSDGGMSVTERGVVYSTSSNPTTSNSKVTSGSGTGSFSVNLTNLVEGTTYYVRAYATNEKGTAYGEQKSFTTKVYTLPTVTTSSATNIAYTTATIGGNVTSDGGMSVTERGVVYSTSANPTTANSKVTSGSGTGSFTCSLTNLQEGTTYYVRAYAVNEKGTAYGEQKSFTTKAYALPTVTTSSATNISTTSVTIGGNVTSDGGMSVTERGVVYSTSPNPTTSNSKVTSGSGTGSFTCSLTNLQEGTTYYVRAYATNEQGTAYGAEKSFTTSSVALPTVTTSSVTNISKTSATVGGNVTSDGGASVTERGVVYSTSSNPTTSNSKVTSGSGTGSFTCSLTNLQEGTTYYVRAYATNEKGTAYGAEKSFTTSSVALPTVTTSSVTNISKTSATVGGNVTSDGGASVTERGIVYSTVSNPVINNIYHTTKVVGSGTGSFSVNLTNLVEGTTYYVRAYATNEKGTAYGNQVVFTTLEAPIENGHEYVDLGLSVKWATCNLGGTKPEDYGDQFSWGEATPSWGGRWRLPTAGEIDELINSCTFTWTTLNSVNGYKVVSRSNGNSIFLPAAGYNGSSFRGSYGMYWTSSLNTYDSSRAYCLYFWNITVKKEILACTYRHSVRLVCP